MELGERINWNTKCYACGKTGHLARNCIELNKRDSSGYTFKKLKFTETTVETLKKKLPKIIETDVRKEYSQR